MKKHVVTGPIQRLSQCRPTITNSYSYSWIPMPDVSTDTFWYTKIVSHNNNQHTNSATKISRRFYKFPEDVQDFQEEK